LNVIQKAGKSRMMRARVRALPPLLEIIQPSQQRP